MPPSLVCINTPAPRRNAACPAFRVLRELLQRLGQFKASGGDNPLKCAVHAMFYWRGLDPGWGLGGSGNVDGVSSGLHNGVFTLTPKSGFLEAARSPDQIKRMVAFLVAAALGGCTGGRSGGSSCLGLAGGSSQQKVRVLRGLRRPRCVRTRFPVSSSGHFDPQDSPGQANIAGKTFMSPAK